MFNSITCKLKGSSDFKNDIYGTPYSDNYNAYDGFALYKEVDLSDQILGMVNNFSILSIITP
jgi:hypothetical protein